MNENEWPEGLFYIRPRRSPDWALLVTIGTKVQGYWIGGAKLDRDDKNQQWKAEEISEGDRTRAVIRNQGLNLVLAGTSTDPNYVAPQVFNSGDSHQTWAVDGYPRGGFRRIQCLGYSENTWMQGNPRPSAPSAPLMLLAGYNDDWGDFELVPVPKAS